MFYRSVCLLSLVSLTGASLDPQPPIHDYEVAPRALSFDSLPPFHNYDLGPLPQHEYHNLATRALDSGDLANNDLPSGELDNIPGALSPLNSQEYDLPDELNMDTLPPFYPKYLGLPQPQPEYYNQDLDAPGLGEQPVYNNLPPFDLNPDMPLQENVLMPSNGDSLPPLQTNLLDPPTQPGYPNLNPQSLGFGQLPAYFDMHPAELNLSPREFDPVPASSFSEHELFPGGPDLDPPPPFYRYDLNMAEELFHRFMAKYHRHYSPEEYLKRLEVFKENLQEINNDNELSLLQGVPPAAGINIFADQSWAEFAAGVEPLLRVRTAVVYSVLTKIMRRKGI